MFKAGDKVKIISCWVSTVNGQYNVSRPIMPQSHGEIISINEYRRFLKYLIRFPDALSGCVIQLHFSDHDIEALDKTYPLPEPEFDLEDIEFAEMIMDGMKDA